VCRDDLRWSSLRFYGSCVVQISLSHIRLTVFPSAVELVLQKAQAVEKAVLRNLRGVNNEYKAKIRSLFVNLKDKSNPSLRVRIVEGTLSPEKFASMTSQVGSISMEILYLTHSYWTGNGVRGEKGR